MVLPVTQLQLAYLYSTYNELHLEKKVLSLHIPVRISIAMDFEGIPRISDEVNSEFQSMNEEFTDHYDEKDDSDNDSHTSIIVNLDKSAEDQVEEAVVRDIFYGEPCCTLIQKKCLLDSGWP